MTPKLNTLYVIDIPTHAHWLTVQEGVNVFSRYDEYAGILRTSLGFLRNGDLIVPINLGGDDSRYVDVKPMQLLTKFGIAFVWYTNIGDYVKLL